MVAAVNDIYVSDGVDGDIRGKPAKLGRGRRTAVARKTAGSVTGHRHDRVVGPDPSHSIPSP